MGKGARALCALSFLCLPRAAAAEGTGADFLLLNMDARTAAQGGASVGRAADLGGLRSNPAGLAGIGSPQASLTHVSSFGEWDHDWLAGALPLGRGVLGLELLSSRLHPFTYYNDLGQEAGTLNAGSVQGALAYAESFGPVSLGVTGRLFRGQLAEYSNWGYSGDLGVQWRPQAWASVGAALQHLGEQTAYLAQRDSLPTLWRAGAQLQSPPVDGIALGAGVDIVQSVDPGRGPELHLGGEALLLQRLALRLGLASQDQAWAPTAGLGFRLAGLELAYAYRPVEGLGADHSFTLSLRDLAGLFPVEGPAKK